ncbi:MAG TPA: cation diffusion facilitator family transporter [Thermoplasmata archaeon]|nr:cation diffusion facilitator family transporter [Thermoplasmata archaeon]
MRSGFILGSAIVLDAALFGLTLNVALAGNSRAVYSQAVYNAADLVGIGMITWGYFASKRPPDVNHPFGYGKERWFWAYSASLVTFSLAGVGVLASGLSQAIAPSTVSDIPAGLVVVGATLLASILGVYVVLRELRAEQSTVQSFIESSHQSLKTVFYQDIVSVVGSAFAFGGLLVVFQTGNDSIDGITAAGVGMIMLLTGVVLAAESRELLVGKSLSRAEASRILTLVEAHPKVRRVRAVQSMMLGPEDALLALKINFADALTTDDIERTIDEISAEVRRIAPVVRHLVIEPES